MVRLFTRARATAFSAMFGALVSPAANAADMPFAAQPLTPVNEQPVEWGTGWYLRGQVGAADNSLSTIDGVVLSRNFPSNWTAGLGGGYQYNTWFRTDVTVDYQFLYDRNGVQNVFMPCFAGAGLTACSPLVSNKAESLAILGNAYLDLGNWWGITPYVGVGAGVDVLRQRAQVGWIPAGIPYTWGPSYSGYYLRFAYAGMVGLTYDLTSHIKIDLGYRWINLGKIEGFDLYNNRFSRNLYSNQVRIGLHYVID
jgi:opacity protein-like surface antigen